MSLDYNLRGIDNYETTCFKPDEHPEAGEFEGMFGRHRYEQDGKHYVMNWELHALLFLTMRIGMGTITNQNIDEFWRRLFIVERSEGAFLYTHDPETKVRKPCYLTYADLLRYRGLVTNVSYVPPRKWNVHQMETLSKDANTERDRQLKEAEKCSGTT